MRRSICLGFVVGVALAGAANAADLPSPAPPPVYVPPVPIFTWTGFYIGGHVGYVWTQNHVNFGDADGPEGSFGNFSYSADGVIGGAHVGYNLQLNQFVIGLEGSVDPSSIKKTINTFGGGDVTVDYSAKSDIQGSIRGRLGYAWDRVLIYATGGVAFAGVSDNLQIGFPFGTFDSAPSTRVGWAVGGGLEYAISNNWSVRAEYRYSDFGRTTFFPSNFGVADPGIFITNHFAENQVQVGFSYKFDTPAPALALVTK